MHNARNRNSSSHHSGYDKISSHRNGGRVYKRHNNGGVKKRLFVPLSYHGGGRDERGERQVGGVRNGYRNRA